MQIVGKFSLLCLLLFRGASAGTFSVILDDYSEIFANVGESLTLNVTVTDFSDSSIFEIYHRNVLTSAEKLLVSMEDYNITSAMIEDGYSISATNGTYEKTISFVIASLTFHDDGAIDFHFKSTTGRSNRTETRNITVVVIPDEVKIRFGNRDDVATNSTQAVQVNSGNIRVYCIVEESNPQITDISLTLNGDDVALETGPDSDLISPDERKYSNNVSAIVEIPSNTTGTQTLICVAVDYFGDSHAVQFLYTLNGAREGQKPVPGLVMFLAILLLWHRL